jgi:hypothetical protein
VSAVYFANLLNIKNCQMDFKKPLLVDPDKPCTKTQLAQEMGISLTTLQKLLKEAGIVVPRKLIPPKLKREILDKLGW